MEERWAQLFEDIHEIRLVLAKQHAVLQEHHRRSVANEQAVAMLRREIAPIQLRRALWATAGKILTGAGGLASAVLAILAVLKLLGKL